MRRHGRTVGAEPWQPAERAPIHLSATLQAAATRNLAEPNGGFRVKPADLQQAIQARPQHRLIVFAVDASDSMAEGATTSRIAVAKAAVLALLNKAYLSRDRVCMIIFQDDRARTILPPTTSIDIARQRLRKLPVGGSTPLARGLLECWRIIKKERQADPSGRPLLVLLSDGDANAPISKKSSPEDEVMEISRKIADDNIPAIIIETGANRPGSLMCAIADIFNTTCYRSSELKTSRVIEMVDRAE